METKGESGIRDVTASRARKRRFPSCEVRKAVDGADLGCGGKQGLRFGRSDFVSVKTSKWRH